MADKKPTDTQVAQAEPTYEATEIAANAPRLFGYNVDIATAAFKVSGTERATLTDAKKIIKDFAEKRV
jgi:hypothetical protein